LEKFARGEVPIFTSEKGERRISPATFTSGGSDIEKSSLPFRFLMSGGREISPRRQ
jgi:hypothetical protein